MSKQGDLLAPLDPDVQRERIFAKEVAIILVAHVGRPMGPGEPKDVAVDLGKRIASLARERFSGGVGAKKKDT
jgi:hypothetical protein